MIWRIFAVCALLLCEVQSQSCNCDLLGGQCDVNCCCDPNCNGNDTSVFSFCISTGISTNFSNSLCTYNEVLYVNNVQVERQVQQDGLFCIILDNFSSRNFFQDPSCATQPNTCFDTADTGFSFADSSFSQPTNSLYQVGDSILASFNSNSSDSGLFTVPTSSFSPTCQDSPVRFLVSETKSCTRLGALSSICNTSLNYRTYWEGLSLYMTPVNSSSTDPIVVQGCIVNGINNSCNDAQFVNESCLNAVTSVTYNFVTNDLSNSIVSASVSLVLRDLQAVDFPVTQTFKVSFQTSNASPTDRAGYPGYVLGLPLLSAVREQDSNSVANILQNNVLGIELTLINPSSTGTCESAQALTRLPILFGEDKQTGCRLPVNNDCQSLGSLVQYTLDGYTFDAFNGSGVVFIGTYGNSSINNLINFEPTDWIQVIQQAYPPTSVETNGCSISLSSQVEILFANSGALANPQSKIVGARYSYGTPEFLRFRCSTTPCDQLVDIYTSVRFIDVSQSPISIERVQPTINANLPSDFYHPIGS